MLPAALGLTMSAFATALVGLSLNVSAFNSETFRAGILSLLLNSMLITILTLMVWKPA